MSVCFGKHLKRELGIIRNKCLEIPGMKKFCISLFGTKIIPKVKGLSAENGLLDYSEAMNEAIDYFDGELNDAERKKIKKDIVNSWIKNKTSPHEYYIFGFRDLSETERRKFVSRREKDDKMCESVGDKEAFLLLHDKYTFYSNFKDFFGREVCRLSSSNTADFKNFCRKKRKYIAKNETGRMGVGTVIREYDGNVDNIEKETEYLLSNGNAWVIEEVVQQDERMAVLNDSSLNTVRICSRWNGSGIDVFEAAVRMGRKGMVIDNLSNGGITALVDPESGEVITDGIDSLCHFYDKHPDNGVRIKGYVIPEWKSLLSIAEKAHSRIKDYPYVGWDFALSKKGWVLIEGNWGNFITQYFKIGIREEFEKCFN